MNPKRIVVDYFAEHMRDAHGVNGSWQQGVEDGKCKCDAMHGIRMLVIADYGLRDPLGDLPGRRLL